MNPTRVMTVRFKNLDTKTRIIDVYLFNDELGMTTRFPDHAFGETWRVLLAGQTKVIDVPVCEGESVHAISDKPGMVVVTGAK